MRVIMGAALVVLLLAGSAHAGSWKYDEVKDPITDAARGIAYLQGQGGTLVAKCDKNGPAGMYLQIISDKYLGAVRNPSREVIQRLDESPPTRNAWYHDKSNALLFDNKQATNLAYSFSRARKIVFRLTTYEGSTVDILLEADGNDEVVRKAFATCGQAWPETPPPKP